MLRALLRGEDVEWQGGVLRMLHPSGFGAARPLDVPVLIGADGPKGLAVAAELGDGVFSAGLPQEGARALPWRALLQFGTVLDDGEAADAPRVTAAAGHAAAVTWHAAYERGGTAVDGLPGGRRWREQVEAVPERERHLAIHEGHLIAPNDRDRAALAGAPELLPLATLTGTPEQLRGRLARLADAGVTEVAYQPAGPDIPRELRTFAAMARG